MNHVIKIGKYKTKFIISLIEIFVTNVIILKIVYLNFFFKELIKIKIFI